MKRRYAGGGRREGERDGGKAWKGGCSIMIHEAFCETSFLLKASRAHERYCTDEHGVGVLVLR